ncbi:MAG TPA: hypothetical protein VMT47_07085 [Polyangia bacterium]|nr:hypothetical protein [Polyangia bacterium]
MSIFAKKPDWGQPGQPVMADPPSAPTAVAKASGYGITEAINLLRGLPIDQNGDLVIRVMSATLASVDVHLRDIIDDATKRQKSTHERIAAVHAQMADLDRQLEAHRREVAALEAELKETTTVKERLQHAEKTAALAAAGGRSVPPPPPEGATTAKTSGKTPVPELPRPQ